MAVKPSGQLCGIREQIIEDPVSGLTFQFLLVPDSDAPVRLRVFGALPHGNREFLFDRNGQEAGAGTAFSGTCRPSWLREVSG
ncbi:MAG: hypothetical protein O7A64_08590 [Alphaproteobacteria bacterium]|jgi:hypothetical protein|nr:hypothetical protein [Alphaproteobacteria bacterium]